MDDVARGTAVSREGWTSGVRGRRAGEVVVLVRCRIAAGRTLAVRRGKLRRGLRSRQPGRGSVIDAVQPETARVQALHRLPVIGSLGRMTKRVHRRGVLGKNQQEGEDKLLEQAGSGGRFAVHGDKCLMKHSCSINVVTDHRQATCAMSLTRPAMPGRLCRLLSGSAFVRFSGTLVAIWEAWRFSDTVSAHFACGNGINRRGRCFYLTVSYRHFLFILGECS